MVDENIDHYRICDGFVEIGSKDELNEGDLIWHKKLKIGAKVGDRWEDGDSKYEVTKINNRGGRVFATIENRLLGDKIETHLELDFGPFTEKWLSRGEEMRETFVVPR